MIKEELLTNISRYIKEYFPKALFSCKDYSFLWAYSNKDKKKKTKEKLTMILLEDVGKPVIAEDICKKEWEEALDFYQDFM